MATLEILNVSEGIADGGHWGMICVGETPKGCGMGRGTPRLEGLGERRLSFKESLTFIRKTETHSINQTVGYIHV